MVGDGDALSFLLNVCYLLISDFDFHAATVPQVKVSSLLKTLLNNLLGHLCLSQRLP